MNINVLKQLLLLQININTNRNDNKFGYDIYSYVGKKSNKKFSKF